MICRNNPLRVAALRGIFVGSRKKDKGQRLKDKG